MHSPFGGWRHHLARWEACHWIRGSRGSPMNPVPLPPPQFGGAAKGKRLNGQARRLTSPLWRSYAGPPQGHYKAPLCCELLMKGLLFRALFCPRLRGKSGVAGKGEASAASQSAELFSCHMTLKANPVTLTLYSSPERAIPQPSARRAVKPKNLKNPRDEVPSTLTPQACPRAAERPHLFHVKQWR